MKLTPVSTPLGWACMDHYRQGERTAQSQRTLQKTHTHIHKERRLHTWWEWKCTVCQPMALFPKGFVYTYTQTNYFVCLQMCVCVCVPLWIGNTDSNTVHPCIFFSIMCAHMYNPRLCPVSVHMYSFPEWLCIAAGMSLCVCASEWFGGSLRSPAQPVREI